MARAYGRKPLRVRGKDARWSVYVSSKRIRSAIWMADIPAL